MKRSFSLFLCGLRFVFAATVIGQSHSTPPSHQLTVSEIVHRTSGAVVQVVVSDQDGKEFALGSGFLVSADGKIVTNFHVIEGAHSAVVKLANGSFFPVEGVLASDSDRDLVILKVAARALPFLTLDPSASLQVGAAMLWQSAVLWA
jgi:S1-C subfamily serine protease